MLSVVPPANIFSAETELSECFTNSSISLVQTGVEMEHCVFSKDGLCVSVGGLIGVTLNLLPFARTHTHRT